MGLTPGALSWDPHGQDSGSLLTQSHECGIHPFRSCDLNPLPSSPGPAASLPTPPGSSVPAGLGEEKAHQRVGET